MCCRFHPIRDNIFYASGACGNIFMCTTDTNEFSRFIEGANNLENVYTSIYSMCDMTFRTEK